MFQPVHDHETFIFIVEQRHDSCSFLKKIPAGDVLSFKNKKGNAIVHSKAEDRKPLTSTRLIKEAHGQAAVTIYYHTTQRSERIYCLKHMGIVLGSQRCYDLLPQSTAT